MSGIAFIPEPMELPPFSISTFMGFFNMLQNRREKNTEPLRVHLGESLKADLMTAAGKAGFDALSPFVRHILHRWTYGNFERDSDLLQEAVRDE